MLEKVKLALRISHNYLDSDIEETITTARAELVRAGVSPSMASGDSDLVTMLIKTYCQYVYCGNEKMAEKYFESFQYQLDNLRKSIMEGEDV